MYQVIKRDGHVAEFSLNRISSAIMKAFDATQCPGCDRPAFLAGHGGLCR